MIDRLASRVASPGLRHSSKMRASTRPLLACMAAAIICSTSLAHKPDERRADRSSLPWLAQMHYVMGTMLEIQIPSVASNQQLLTSLFDIARRHDEVFSAFKHDSPLSRFNRSGGKGVVFQAPLEMVELASISQRFAEQTEGAFDVTVGPLMRLWKEAARLNRWPSVDEVRKARERVGARLLAVDPKAGTITPLADGVELDFNGIAKGYSVDKMAETLRGAGLNQALINFGESSIFALGNDPDGRPWRVEVRNPQRPGKAALRLRLSDMAISSSGSYENSIRVAGRTVSHIIDPRIGMPADSARAVTVVAPNATVAEALSKPLVVLPVTEGLKLLARFPDAEALIFYRLKGGRWKRAMSHGMRKFVE